MIMQKQYKGDCPCGILQLQRLVEPRVLGGDRLDPLLHGGHDLLRRAVHLLGANVDVVRGELLVLVSHRQQAYLTP